MALYPGFYPGATSFPGVEYPANDASWWIGPLGRLRRLPAPERNLSADNIRYGGIHQGISGARTVDRTGFRQDYEFTFKYLDAQEWLWLDVLHTRVVPGPLYLINPLKTNRLSTRAVQGYDMDPVGSAHGGASSAADWSRVNDYPTGLGIPAVVHELNQYPGDFGYLIFDREQPFPLLPGEKFCMSVWVRTTRGPMDVGIRVDWYEQDGTSDLAQGSSAFEIGPKWQRVSLESVIPPAGYVGQR